MKTVIVIPTYNEKENIEKVIELLVSEFKLIPGHEMNILVVDGNSPDGTGDLVKKMSEKYPFVSLLLEKEKAGLGAAYKQGFKHAIKEMDAEVLIEMDADMQHDPKTIKEFMKKIDEGYDYVIGSRFAKGGSIPKEWATYRKILSVGGNVFSKIVLGIMNVNDFTTGFKASRVKGFADKLDMDNIRSEGFAYKIDLLFKMHKLGAKIVEVPIKFGLRDKGDSKMEGGNFTDSLKVVLSLRIEESKSFIKFLVVGFIGLFADSGSFNLIRLVPAVTSSWASLLSGGIGMLTTFFLNNYWSFGDRKLESAEKKIIGIVVYFVSSSVPIIFRKYLIGWFTATWGDTFFISNLAFFIGIVIGLVWNFTVYSKIIWRKNK